MTAVFISINNYVGHSQLVILERFSTETCCKTLYINVYQLTIHCQKITEEKKTQIADTTHLRNWSNFV